jgi:hypothetical protein
MNKPLRRLVSRLPFFYPLRNWRTLRRQEEELLAWEKKGRPVPPPHLAKQQALVAYARRFGLTVLVETGTYYGDMVEAMKRHFDRIISVELSRELFAQARERFGGQRKIELVCGDSAVEIEKIVKRLDRPALFWLDAHHSAGVTAKGSTDTSICEELGHILRDFGRGHVVIIDDAQCFGRDPDYPSIPELIDFVRARAPSAEIAVEQDGIRITPGKPA